MAPKSNFIVRGGLDVSDIKKGLVSTQTQLTSFKNGVSKSVKGIATVLSGLAIGSYIKDSISAASNLESAMSGLESIVSGQGRSISKAKSFINGYIKDGLVPLANAVTAYKTLSMRGYSEEQIEILMNRLKDSASYGRQASLTLGAAVQSATEGLKNENSILVDNAGVTKNVSKMWEDYAKSIGKTVANLTLEEKRQAEVNGIMQETGFQVGDAAKYTTTFAGRLSVLKKVLLDIKVNIGNAFMALSNIGIPVLQSIANKVSDVTAKFSSFIQTIFGKAISGATTSTENLSDSVTSIGDAATSTGKKLSNALGIDELNQLNSDSSSGASTASATSTVPSDVVDTKLSKVADAISSSFSKLDLETMTTNLKNFGNAISPYAKSFGKGFVDFFEDIGGLAIDTIKSVLGKNGILSSFTKVLEDGDPDSASEWGYSLGQLAVGIASLKLALSGIAVLSTVVNFAKTVGSAITYIAELNPANIVMLVETLYSINPAFRSIADSINTFLTEDFPVTKFIQDLLNNIANAIGKIPSQIGPALANVFNWEDTLSLFKEAGENFTNAFDGQNIGLNVVKGVANGLWGGVTFILEPFQNIIQTVLDLFGIHSPSTVFAEIGMYIIQGLFNGISDQWKAVSNWWETNISPWFSEEKWDTILAGIPKAFSSAFGNAAKFAVGIFNSVFKTINEKLNISWSAQSVLGKEIIPAGNFQLFTIPEIQLPAFSNGGFVEDGLFQANDDELIGQFSNGKTAVANNDQIVEGIKRGVSDANSVQNQLLSEQNALLRELIQKELSVNIGDKEIARANKRGVSSLGYAFN